MAKSKAADPLDISHLRVDLAGSATGSGIAAALEPQQPAAAQPAAPPATPAIAAYTRTKRDRLVSMHARVPESMKAILEKLPETHNIIPSDLVREAIKREFERLGVTYDVHGTV